MDFSLKNEIALKNDFELNDVLCDGRIKCMSEEREPDLTMSSISRKLYKDSKVQGSRNRTGDNLSIETAAQANRAEGMLAPGDSSYLTHIHQDAGLDMVDRYDGCLDHLDEKMCAKHNEKMLFNGMYSDQDAFVWKDGKCCSGDKVRGHETEIDGLPR